MTGEGPTATAPYPAHWEADVVLRDGGTAHVRPITPQDADRLRAFHRRQSAESIYLRFFAPYPELSDRDVERFTHVDHHDRVGLVATIGDDIVAVVRYDRTGPDEAEVAFNISDAHQGRGLGSVMLEHIAAAARERGVRRFVAEVLPTNRRMIRVFQDAGYEVRSAFDDGIVHLSFEPALTGTALEVLQDREQRAEARSIERLLTPRSVAVVGASREYDSVGQTVLRNLRAAGPPEVWAVNPGAREVAGVPAYPSILDVPGEVDLAVLAVPAAAAQEVVAQCAAKGVRSLVVLSAGYAETGPVGRERQRALVAAARASGMRVVGPNSFGVVSTDPEHPLNASLATTVPPVGRIGFFSQSGALGLAILDAVAARGLGLSSFVSAGNRADVSGNDLLQFWDQDQRTDVVLLYLESIGNPRKFSRLARRLAARKPVATIKAGRTTQGVPLGHAVRRSTVPAAAVDAMFAQAGVIRVDTMAQLLDVGQLLVTQPLPAGDRVVILGNSDALGLLAADACAEAGLHVIGQPIALPPAATAEDFRVSLDAVFADPGVDSVVTVFIPPLVTSHEEVAAVLAGAAAASDKTVVATFLGVRGVPEQLRAPGAGGPEPAPPGSVPSYPTPEDAVRALAAATSYADWRRRPRGSVPELDVDRRAARAIARSVLVEAPGGLELGADDAAALLACYGIEVLAQELAEDADGAVAAAARIGYPVVLKAAATHLRARPDLQDVRLDLVDEAAVRRAHAAIVAGLGPGAGRVLVQPMARPGIACVVTSTEDPLFGPVVSFGLAGLATELLGDRAYRIPPLTDTDVSQLVRSVRAAPLLFGHRGAEPVDTDALEDLLLRVARLADEVPQVAELELPVLVAERGLAVLHARVRLAEPAARPDTGPRRLPS
ncbi:GNAT family N-acetyltransferase [Vallicoccus soli]|uniref:GNAT family N-acetyltransferase n=1 Tax=Vallicoccus soli TaxID=2339232 RepID=A0A3A3Z6E9_9ACTN|nr:GNAT family N-acetyltransferase [Vallicoccus soli]RJK96275.1 GNAT family N-acetyltransferase [Vallicoccus soli]